MGFSAVVIASAGAFLNTTSRNVRVDGRESESYFSYTTTTGGTRPVEVRGLSNILPHSKLITFPQGPLRVRNPLSYEEFARPTYPKVVNREDLVQQIPFPRFLSPRSITSVSTGLEDEPPSRYPTKVVGDTVNAVPPQEGIFALCLTFLKCVGAELMTPPYTIDDGLNYIIAGKRGYIDSVSLSIYGPPTVSVADPIIQNVAVTNIPLV